MNAHLLIFAVLGLAFSMPLIAQDDAQNQAIKAMGDETLGKLKLGMTDKAVIKLLGEPQSKGKETKWEAIGEVVQEWKYPAQGLQFYMAGKPKTILSMKATEPCKLATSRGITIGSSEAEVIKNYGKFVDKENTRKGESFVAGSIYGGVIFSFAKGKVSEIFFGAAAE